MCDCRAGNERHAGEEYRLRVDAVRDSDPEFLVRSAVVQFEESAHERGEEGRKKSFWVMREKAIDETVMHSWLDYWHNIDMIAWLDFLLQPLITGDKSSVRYVTYQNEEEDE